jgi:DNA repair protein RadC
MKVAEVKVVYTTLVKNSDRQKVVSSETAFQILKPFYEEFIDYKELSFVILLNRSNRVIGVNKISEGGFSGTIVDAKMVFQVALLTGASGLILSHNHPSGALKPSESDIRMTKQIREFGKMVDLPILDHLIMTSEGYYSFADEGMI